MNFDLLPSDYIARVELLSGTASLLGPDSLGGARNLVTAHGAGPLSGTLETSAGSFGSYRGEASVQGATANHVDYYVAGGTGSENGWRQATSDHTYNGFLNIGRGGTGRGLRLRAYASRSRAQTAGSLPSHYTRHSRRCRRRHPRWAGGWRAARC